MGSESELQKRIYVGFLFKTIFAPHRPITTLVSKDVKFSRASSVYMKNFPDDAHPLERPRKSSKLDFEFSILREYVQIWYNLK